MRFNELLLVRPCCKRAFSQCNNMVCLMLTQNFNLAYVIVPCWFFLIGPYPWNTMSIRSPCENVTVREDLFEQISQPHVYICVPSIRRHTYLVFTVNRCWICAGQHREQLIFDFGPTVRHDTDGTHFTLSCWPRNYHVENIRAFLTWKQKQLWVWRTSS